MTTHARALEPLRGCTVAVRVLLLAPLLATGCTRSGFESWPDRPAPADAGALVGDLDGNGCIDCRDVDRLISAVGNGVYEAAGDLNGDGAEDARDLSLLLAHLGTGCQGPTLTDLRLTASGLEAHENQPLRVRLTCGDPTCDRELGQASIAGGGVSLSVGVSLDWGRSYFVDAFLDVNGDQRCGLNDLAWHLPVNRGNCPITVDVGLTSTSPREACAVFPITGDLNDDGCVDGQDLSIFENAYGQTGNHLPGDFDGNGTVDALDLSLFSLEWGLGCAAADAGQLDAARREDAAHGIDAGAAIDGALCRSPQALEQCLPKPGCTVNACTDLSVLMHFDNRADFGESTHLVHDFSGHDNHASCQDLLCPVWQPSGGRFGGAFLYSGGTRFEIADSASLDLADALTVTAWFYPRSLLDAWRPVVAKVEGTTERSNFWIGHNGAAMCITFNDGSWHNRCSLATYATGTWYHLAGVFDGVNDRITLYVNGAPVVDEADATPLPVENGSVWIGWAPLDDPVEGSIDEVLIFNRALEPDEIYALAH